MSQEHDQFSDIVREEPYVEYETGLDVAYIDMIFVPKDMRSQGVGTRVFNEFLENLDPQIKRLRLKAATLGGCDAASFWKRQGFKEAYTGDLDGSDALDVLSRGVNGYSDPVPEHLNEGDYRHYLEGDEDLAHLAKHPQSFDFRLVGEKRDPAGTDSPEP
jgi:hypothetical protein